MAKISSSGGGWPPRKGEPVYEPQNGNKLSFSPSASQFFVQLNYREFRFGRKREFIYPVRGLTISPPVSIFHYYICTRAATSGVSRAKGRARGTSLKRFSRRNTVRRRSFLSSKTFTILAFCIRRAFSLAPASLKILRHIFGILISSRFSGLSCPGIYIFHVIAAMTPVKMVLFKFVRSKSPSRLISYAGCFSSICRRWDRGRRVTAELLV